ncbi:calcium-binding protein [Tropicimonas sediminicola]|uniref:Ca2+-binding protein, RTX toxin-related n=1 Tax=Tropicimonas sediminicola TaxID=1031541 RepID=A0A239H3H5_9RHOB|nr:calcium-binding protein [Tropicimonas sediminicola]SNS75353.1 Ca2+-binding protein, RTX toxin-related [Tropicimonas sediminicola]
MPSDQDSPRLRRDTIADLSALTDAPADGPSPAPADDATDSTTATFAMPLRSSFAGLGTTWQPLEGPAADTDDAADSGWGTTAAASTTSSFHSSSASLQSAAPAPRPSRDTAPLIVERPQADDEATTTIGVETQEAPEDVFAAAVITRMTRQSRPEEPVETYAAAQAPTELDIYKSRLDRLLPDVTEMRDAVKTIGYILFSAKYGVGAFKTADKTVKTTYDAIYFTDKLLTVVGFVSPLKAPTKAIQQVLKKVKKPVEKVEEKFDDISSKDDKATPTKENNNEFIDKVQANIDKAALANATVQDALTLKVRQMEIASEATGNFQEALAVAMRSGETWSGRYDTLNTAIESQLGNRNDKFARVEALYEDVKAELDDFLEVMRDIDFDKILGELVDLDEIAKIFDFLEKPLEIAGNVLKPILPLLDAVDKLVGLIVDPVIDYVMETLGLGDLLDATEEAVAALIPSLNLLDAFETLMQPLSDFLLEYIIDALGTVPFLDLLEQAIFKDGVVGDAEKGPTGWGNDVANTLEGDDKPDILDALAGDDEIYGYAGNDVIIAGAGSDLLDGGQGNDLFYFGASFTEYELAREPGTANIIVSHLQPKTGVDTGIDTLVSLGDKDSVVFTDVSFTGKELKNAIIGGSILNGDEGGKAADDLMFLNSSGTKVDGLHVANGRKGNDRIFGSTSDDRLNGGSGNDVLLPGSGNDEVNGQAGIDTFQVLEGANTKLTVDLTDGTSFGQGQDKLSSIENVVASPNQDHKIRGTKADNVIHTGDGIDVIAGMGGNDRIEAGGEDDYIVGGPGSDIISAGAGGVDVMISGSRAKQGVRDIYKGGDGYDVVSYTSSSNTIKFDVSDQSDDPSILQTLKNYMQDIPASGPVEIWAGSGRIVRYDTKGNRLAVDRTEDVEGFMGSDQDDILHGDAAARMLHGAGGNDTIYSGGSEYLYGGDGDDLILAEAVDGGASALQIEGGGGYDTLRLDDVGDARWFYRVESAIALTLRAHKTSVEGEDLRNARDVFFSIKPRQVEEISLGDYADHAIYEPGGTTTALFNLRGGDDRFDGENGFADVTAGSGNDIGNFYSGGSGIFRGGAGDDYARYDETDRDSAALMGNGVDTVRIERFFGHANGGQGFDTISFDVSYQSRIEVDLAAGTVASFKGVSGLISEQVGMTLENFETLIATDYNDVLNGSVADEQLIGRGGSDLMRGAGGRDKLFGGASNDTLEGGKGDDLLHGGAGNDLLKGGGGSDTASYAWVRPGGLDGALIADSFSGVTVDLFAGTATGAFGSDTLVSIENVAGSGGDDMLQGNKRDNLLSGDDGDDRLFGADGDDVLVTGSGDDRAWGGKGDDTVTVGLGTKTLFGSDGFDTLDFGTVDGELSVDFAAGSYQATFDSRTPVWVVLDRDGDGVAESDGTEARIFGGVAMTPQQVLETDPNYSNSTDDTTRVLPDEDDEAFDDFRIELQTVGLASRGTFTDFERVVGGNSNDRISGDGSGNSFAGRGGRDILEGFGGKDELRGGLGNDRLLGGGGGDALFGDAGKDRIDGAAGGDRIKGGAGNDTLSGGGGADTILGDGGEDTLDGGIGADTLKGGVGKDLLRGGDGADALSGNDGNDTVKGGGGNDRLFGNKGADRLQGGNGADEIDGGQSADVLNGGSGNDLLTGGRGADDFVFANNHGRDRIADFEARNDREEIDLSAVTRIKDFKDLKANHMKQVGDRVVIDDGANTQIVLLATDLGDLDRQDFLF